MNPFHIIFTIFLFSSLSFSVAQEDEDWMLMKNESTSKNNYSDTSKKSLNFNPEKLGQVNLKVDERVNKLIHLIGSEGPDGTHTIDGYRVQIYFDKSKDNSDREKGTFKARYGNTIGCYVEFKAPNYRIKVGDFRTELEAERYKQKLLSFFPTAFVVSEKIHLPSLSNNFEDEN